jgi:phosphoserine phosphatase RsbU/P
MPIQGPVVPPIICPPEKPVVLGRSSQADVQLSDQVVSRQHCKIENRGETWLITDLDSRHGTYINGIRLNVNEQTPLHMGDRVRLGPWTFRAMSGDGGEGGFLAISDDRDTGSSKVQEVSPQELSIRAEARLDLLIEASAAISAARNEEELANATLGALVSATGFPRAALLRLGGDSGNQVQIIGYRGPGAANASTLINAPLPAAGTLGAMGQGGPAPLSSKATPDMFSRSLLLAAAAGQVVRLGDNASPMLGHSIMHLGIHSALCAPVIVDSAPDAFIYLDARGKDSLGSIQPDAAAFCSAVARICAMALGNIQRRKLEDRQRELERDLKAARRAQLLITPAPKGTHGLFTWAMHSQPGRYVAGDLVDFIPLDDGRLAVLLGDVSGKGVGTALLMASAQSHLSALLRAGHDPAASVSAANRFVASYSDRQITETTGGSMFISLWCGVFDPVRRLVDFVDAGHGYVMSRDPSGRVQRVESAGGPVMGVSADVEYRNESAPIPAGTRFIVFSDGVAEQGGVIDASVQFGWSRLHQCLAPAAHADGDVGSMLQALREHAGGNVFGDDVTIASIAVG